MGGSCSSGNSDVRHLNAPREEVVREVYDRLTHVVEERVLNARRVPQRQYDCDYTGPMYTQWVLTGHRRNLPDVFHIDHTSFYQLRDALLNGGYFVQGHRGVEIEEALLIFLSIVCGDERFRTVCQRYQHSSATITRTVIKVRKSIVRLSAVLICPVNEHVVHPRIRNDSRLYPYFKDCIGALDGTHIEATVTPSESRPYRNRHASLSQNVLGVVDNNRRFVYVFVGMGGSAHDARVLDTSLEPRHMFPLPPVGKYYVADSAYQSKPGFMCPFRNKPYHHTEHTGRGFHDKEELFNHRHSSTRNIVERVFGILKRKFQFLVGPTYSYDLQAQGEFVLACCTIYNMILLHNPDDPELNEPDEPIFDDDGGEDLGWTIPTCHLQPGDRSRQAVDEWNLHRTHIADAMWVNYNV